MNVTINGQDVQLPEHVRTISGIRKHFNIEQALTIIEQNKKIVDKNRYDSQPISDGDRIEIVHFVGGG
ncbi:sulfur carrier protein ThiS [Terrilactibacillus sp. BCM23-1]|uniref:Sulfur carrier protein ThiS n=1 Tax=Terrilactibacillus tamarindi TaxID=2599694 RepID=A0A6N8CM20_9BACI|nr:sulfur carrier protein ThiS [Terrilactibacillus tamarindi]MTT30638.1 sulfur carrier protein ThiS [Terrilactibacillus tamarindi]